MHHATFFGSDADQRADHFGFAVQLRRGLPDTTGIEDSIYPNPTQLTLTNATTGVVMLRS